MAQRPGYFEEEDAKESMASCRVAIELNACTGSFPCCTAEAVTRLFCRSLGGSVNAVAIV